MVDKTSPPPAFTKREWLLQNEKDGSLFALVPGGSFIAGGDAHFESECDPFTAELPAFVLALHPVTNAQYQQFIRATGRPPPRCYRGAGGDGGTGEKLWEADEYPAGQDHYPVTGVRWEDAQAYCNWAGVRLPTELEWEKAARGADGWRHPWGNEWSGDRCRHDDNRRQELTADVWGYAEGCGFWGHYQLAGNVWEWCADWYERFAYKRYSRGDLTPPTSGKNKVVRGGSWFNLTPENFLSTYRLHLPPDEADRQYGFRVAQDIGWTAPRQPDEMTPDGGMIDGTT